MAAAAAAAPGAGPAVAMPQPDFMLGSTRSMVSMCQFNEQKQDYEKSVEGLDPSSEEYRTAVGACHARGAERCAKVVAMHRGLYVKAAQFVASIRGGAGDTGIPAAYIEALSVFTDRAPHKTLGEVLPVLKEAMQLGSWPAEALDETCALRSMEETPIASASLAQVHRAELQDGTKVAVKVQYPELKKEMASDFFVFKTMGAQIKQMSGGYDLMWVVEDLEKNIARELNFELEATNGEETARQLAHLAPRVYVPKVYREYSSRSLLTMEFCEGLVKVNDPAALKDAGLDPGECALLVCETFAEMIFLHGRVHADPHSGNIYIRARDDGGEKRPQLVILDHGLYYDLSENDVRAHFCRYWKACCAKDSATMDTIGRRFAGELRRFLPMMLCPWFVFGGTGVSLGEIITAAQGQLPDTIGLRDIADFVMATRDGGANLIGLLHSLGYTRGLLNDVGFPEHQRVSVMLKYAVLGDTAEPPAVPPPLTANQQAWVRWRVMLLSGHIRIMEPIARPLIRYVRAEHAPPLWLVASFPVLLAAVGVGFLSRMRAASPSLTWLSWLQAGKALKDGAA